MIFKQVLTAWLQRAHRGFLMAGLATSLILSIDAFAFHALAVVPENPASGDMISIQMTGQWPGGGSPEVLSWDINDGYIRIDAQAVLPGIIMPDELYREVLDIGRLSAGRYHVDYFIEVFAAPEPPAMGEPPPVPDASLDFVVSADPSAVPVMSIATLLFLILLMLLPAVMYLKRIRSG